MKETDAEPRVICIEPSENLEACIAGEPRTGEPYLVQIGVFSDPGGRSVTLSFTTQDEKPSEQATAQDTSSFTVSVPDARKLAHAIKEAIGDQH